MKFIYGFLTGIVSTLAVLLGVGAYFFSPGTFAAGEMPACDSRFATMLLKNIIEGSAEAKLRQLRVADIRSGKEYEGPLGDAAQVSGSWKPIRACIANVNTNKGERDVVFTLAFTSVAEDRVYLRMDNWMLTIGE